MTPTERLQADWPKWEIRISEMCRPNGFGQPCRWEWEVSLEDTNAWMHDDGYKSEAEACDEVDEVLRAIREAVT